jgi:MFS family permease
MTAGAASSPRWYHGWNIVAACVIAQAAVMSLPINAFSLFLGIWSKELHAPISTLLISMTALSLASAVYSPITGTLADKYPARLLFGAGLLGGALLALAISFVTAPWQLLALYAVVVPATLSLATLIPANALVSRWFVRRLGVAMGIAAFGQSIAGVLAPPIVAQALTSMDWRQLFRIDAVLIAVVVTPPVLWVMRDRPLEHEGVHYLGTAAAAPGSLESLGEGSPGVPEILRRKTFWLLLAVCMPLLGAYGTCLQNLGPIATSHGFGPEVAAGLLSAFSISQIAATLAAGALSDRFGNRGPLAGMAAVTAVGLALLGFGSSLPVLGAGVVLVGVGGGFWPLLSAATAVEFGARAFGRAFGLMGFCLPFGAVSSFIVAKAQETTGSYALPLAALGAATLAGGVVCGLLMRERRTRLATVAAEAA